MQAHQALPALCAAALLAATLSAQSPANDIDAHISAAKAAAGLQYRATFVNLECATVSKLRNGAK